MLKYIFVVLGITLILFSLLYSKKYEIIFLIKNQIKSFCDYETRDIIFIEVLGFFIGPLLLTIGLVNIGFYISTDGLSILLNIVSIITGLLISSLLGINSFQKNDRIKRLIEITSNYILFAILLTIILFLISIFKIFNFEFIKLLGNIKEILKKIQDGIIFYIFVMYILDFFLILKKLIQIFMKKD